MALAESDSGASAADPARSPAAGEVEPGARGLEAKLRALAGHAPLVLVGFAAACGPALLAKAWFVASRLAYVGFVGLALNAESKRGALSRRLGAERAWRRFARRASRLMVGDAVALGALCIATRGTLALPLPDWIVYALGAGLVVLGVGIKIWATVSLDAGTFYWRDFFVPHAERSFSAVGPYRWISNPMYSLGYAHAYGFALLLGSLPGLAGAAFAQVGVLLLAFLVERPHVRRFERD